MDIIVWGSQKEEGGPIQKLVVKRIRGRKDRVQNRRGYL